MNSQKKDLTYYEQLLPQSVQVEVHQEEDGSFWARVLDFKGCYTQGKDFRDLLEMVSDAIYTVLDVPEEFRAFLPRYIPEEIREALEKHESEKQFTAFIADQIHGKRELVFTR
ncbi:MAG: type II toxin-antitoxin system HicB family antitoxin [Candidatus Sungbacteria bacterium]|uniref:Type II toxin-antitoxin system HicB family antitoxin n=1 Tax=Candidatus Sungiibacteriota bacterium TaxID=2750080 RepID=A0A9D6QTS5_9BACT|nr:type II toxin-antitoxin system HicB family antitoxin [Candidatus Sungbacteria bacterium]